MKLGFSLHKNNGEISSLRRAANRKKLKAIESMERLQKVIKNADEIYLQVRKAAQ